MSAPVPDVVGAYFDCANSEDWDRMAQLWTDDAEHMAFGARGPAEWRGKPIPRTEATSPSSGWHRMPSSQHSSDSVTNASASRSAIVSGDAPAPA